jgi:hypothetical protein
VQLWDWGPQQQVGGWAFGLTFIVVFYVLFVLIIIVVVMVMVGHIILILIFFIVIVVVVIVVVVVVVVLEVLILIPLIMSVNWPGQRASAAAAHGSNALFLFRDYNNEFKYEIKKLRFIKTLSTWVGIHLLEEISRPSMMKSEMPVAAGS